MRYTYSSFSVFADGESADRVCVIFSDEIEQRTGKRPLRTEMREDADIVFETSPDALRDGYSIAQDGQNLTFLASTVRGLIFAVGLFLRRSEISDGCVTLIENIGGEYIPDKRIRGHQLGYRTTPNSYDAWDLEDYRRYYLDLMFFGCNTVEHIPYDGIPPKINKLMKYHPEEFLIKASEIADEYDLDVSLWYPNDEEPIEKALKRRERVFSRTPRIDIVFPPGGDPGEYDADEFIERCRTISKLLKKIHPNAEMWPSAQQPHSIPDWGETLIEQMNRLPDEIDGIITGPNRAFPLDELRRRLPAKYPIRLYPDITHNVRCEYPVHFDRDDWHYALTTGLSRECTNPRPAEYRLIHRLTRRYIVGSVSYSEGITDDVNKCVWSDMDFFPDVDLRDTLEDYSRLYFPGLPADEVADRILGLELNWQTDPAENPCIDDNLAGWESLTERFPHATGLWRFNQCLFRAKCDAFLRQKRIAELRLVKEASKEILSGNLDKAESILRTEAGPKVKALRADIERIAQELFEQIGLQTDVERYCADGWERGAVLETIDLPTTDRDWLLSRFEKAQNLNEEERAEFLRCSVNRNKVGSDEYYFSVAQHGLEVLGCPQEGEMYMNFQGDRPNVNNGTLPTCLFKVYDNQALRCKLGGFTPGEDYELKVTYRQNKIPLIKHLTVTANGHTVYDGPQFGEPDEEFDREMLPEGFESAVYQLPANVFENGCVELVISEKLAGVMISEFRIVKKRK